MEPLVFLDDSGNGYLYSPYKKKMIYLYRALYSAIEYCLHCLKPVDELLCSDSFILSLDNKTKQDISFLYNHGFLTDTTEDYSDNQIQYDFDCHYSDVKQYCFELTQKCNLQCTYCCYGDLYEHEGNDHTKEMSADNAYVLIDTICEDYQNRYGNSVLKNITIGFYGGEPLLRMDLLKSIVQYCECRSKSINNLRFSYIITTNGILLQRYINFLIKHNFMIMVSLDGNYENSAFRTTSMGKNVFNTVFKNLCYINDHYSAFFDKNITFNSVVHSKNSPTEIVDFFYKSFKKIPQLSEIASEQIKQGSLAEFRNVYKPICINCKDFNGIIPQTEYLHVDKEMKNIPHFFYKLLDMNIADWSDLFCIIQNSQPFNICLPFVNKVFISADGKLHLCEHIGSGYSFGYIDLESKKIILNIDFMNRISKEYISKQLEKCNQCYNSLFCEQCVFQCHFNCSSVTKEQFLSIIAHNIELLRKRSLFVKYQ